MKYKYYKCKDNEFLYRCNGMYVDYKSFIGVRWAASWCKPFDLIDEDEVLFIKLSKIDVLKLMFEGIIKLGDE